MDLGCSEDGFVFARGVLCIHFETIDCSRSQDSHYRQVYHILDCIGCAAALVVHEAGCNDCLCKLALGPDNRSSSRSHIGSYQKV